MASSSPINIGCLLFNYQALDVIGPCDLLNSASKRLMKGVSFYTPIPESTIQAAPDFTFHHIAENANEPVHLLTSALTLVSTVSVHDTNFLDNLDILLVGGDSPARSNIPDSYKTLIARHISAGKLLFATCTGSAIVASSGALDGRKATVNNLEYNWVRTRYPAVHWTKEQKWVVDGNIWTAGGAIAGMDMVAFWIQQEFGFDVMEMASRQLDFEPRGQGGLFDVLPGRFDDEGRRVATHVFD
ncbi:class I glutamine amidotransferase-like protein [Aspergillus stella-maris]|uniref:class I glutamine amidotransferase-like protein n=1 Tax=Aspergillus stella-maris TaxID=1810926 RepID=UPI003CCCC5A0